MRTLKQQLTDEPQTLQSDADILHLFFSEKIKKFCLELNGKLFTFKNWNSFVKKRNQIIEKYKLSNIETEYPLTQNECFNPK